MKPAPFDYVAPDSLEEALLLVGEDSRPLAGGQSLVPMLNFRLARPERIVDLERVPGLAYIETRDATLRIGAMTRHRQLERSPLVAARWPLLAQAVRFVGHAQIRTRGTVGGSVAHADPKAELPVALTALDARFHVRNARSARTLTAGELFTGPLTTALDPDELLVEIEVPPLPPGARTAFVEHARTHGDFALAGAAVVMAPGYESVALLGAGPTPIRVRHPSELDAITDDYRRALLTTLVKRAIAACA